MLTRLDILRKMRKGAGRPGDVRFARTGVETEMAAMCKAMVDMRNESAENRSVEIAKNFLQLGKLTFEEIASSAG